MEPMVLCPFILCSIRKTKAEIADGWRWFYYFPLREVCSGGYPSVDLGMRA